MSQEKAIYKISAREAGKTPNAVRREGKVPGVLYGGTIEGGHPIQIDEAEMIQMFRKNTKSSVIDVDYDGDKGSVIVREIQKHPVNGKVLHVDLQAIRRDEVLTLSIPITYLGEEDVTYRELLANVNLSEIEVKGPADKMPESVEVDLTGKTPEDRIEASIISLPEEVELLTPADAELVSISMSKMEAEVAADEEAAEASAEESAEVPVAGDEEDKEEEEA